MVKSFISFFLSCFLLSYSFLGSQPAWALPDDIVGSLDSGQVPKYIQEDAALLIKLASEALFDILKLRLKYSVFELFLEQHSMPAAHEAFRDNTSFHLVCKHSGNLCSQLALFFKLINPNDLEGVEENPEDSAFALAQDRDFALKYAGLRLHSEASDIIKNRIINVSRNILPALKGMNVDNIAQFRNVYTEISEKIAYQQPEGQERLILELNKYKSFFMEFEEGLKFAPVKNPLHRLGFLRAISAQIVYDHNRLLEVLPKIIP